MVLVQNRPFFQLLFFKQYRLGKFFYNILEQKKTLFYAIKSRSSKSRNIAIFQKGLTHGFGPKMAIFSTSSFQAIQARKKCFTSVQNEKTPFQAIKRRSSKSQRIAIFLRRLTHGFGPKMAIFLTFLGGEGKIVQEIVVYDILQRNNAFLGYKNKKLKKSKIAIFPKGLTHGFGRKMAIFSTSFFQAIQARKKCFKTFQNEKTPFQAIEKEVQKVEEWQFFLRV